MKTNDEIFIHLMLLETANPYYITPDGKTLYVITDAETYIEGSMAVLTGENLNEMSEPEIREFIQAAFKQ